MNSIYVCNITFVIGRNHLVKINTQQYKYIKYNSGLQIISRLAPVKLSGQTYFCSDISHFLPDKHRLRLIAIKVPPQPFT